MSTFLLDTGILVGLLRQAPYAYYATYTYGVLDPATVSLVSVVSKGELLSLSFQFRWGEAKCQKLDQLLQKLPIVDINDSRILNRYAEIDSYSQGKYSGLRVPSGMSARNMGKNDLWIAATASVLKVPLITTDKDFDHLAGVFLEVIVVDPSTKSGTDK